MDVLLARLPTIGRARISNLLTDRNGAAKQLRTTSHFYIHSPAALQTGLWYSLPSPSLGCSGIVDRLSSRRSVPLETVVIILRAAETDTFEAAAH